MHYFLNYFFQPANSGYFRDFSVNIRRRADLKSLAGGLLLAFRCEGNSRPELIGNVMDKWICLRQNQNCQAISIIRRQKNGAIDGALCGRRKTHC
jgi:hypothetical protein